jgi:hypothetical protein
MKNLYRQSQPPAIKIDEIIIAFGTYALGDIKYNIYGIEGSERNEPKSIAAFILCSCLIDQMAAFAYNHPFNENEDYYKKFIREYLPPYYQAYKLYTELRCLLIHGYSIGEHLSLSIDESLPGFDDQTVSAYTLTAVRLYNDLKEAFNKFKSELLSHTPTRENAKKKYDSAPPLTEVNHNYHKFSKSESDYLIKHYTRLVKRKFLNANKAWVISSIIKKKIDDSQDPYIVLVVAKSNGRNFGVPLERVTTQFRIASPIESLKTAGLYEERSID